MGFDLAKNWPAYLLLGGFITFVIFAFRNSRQQEKKNKAVQGKENDKPKA